MLMPLLMFIENNQHSRFMKCHDKEKKMTLSPGAPLYSKGMVKN